MLPLEVMGVSFVEGERKNGGGHFCFSRILVSLPEGSWYEVTQNGKVDLQKGDTALFDIGVRMGRLALIYTGQHA